MRRRSVAGIGVVVALAAATPLHSQIARAQERTVVFAAASMQTALDAVVVAWESETGGDVVVSYAASSALARQIEQGAPADIFISADIDWMDYLAERALIDTETRIDLLANRLVLIAPAGEAEPVEITAELDLDGLLRDGRLAVADTNAVPAGRYARAALESLGLWEAVGDRLAPAANVRAALAFVSRGETPLGIVYATDDFADPNVEAIGIFPADSHPPIVYPAAIVAGSSGVDAEAFLAWLRSTAARCIFAAEGFTLLAVDGSPPADCPAG